MPISSSVGAAANLTVAQVQTALETSALDLADAPSSTAVPADGVLSVKAGNVVTFPVGGVGPTAMGRIAGADRLRFRGAEDFYGFATVTADASPIAGTPWLAQLAGAGAQVAQVEGSEIFVGVLVHGAAELATGTTTTGRCATQLGAGGFLWNPGQTYRYGAALRIPTLSDGTNQFEAQFGLLDVTNSVTQAQGVYFRAQHGDSTYEAVAIDDSNVTVVNTGVTIDANYHVFTIEYLGDGTAHFYIDGVSVAAITTNMPDDATLLRLAAAIYKAAGTTSRSIRIDAISWDLPANRTKSLIGMP